MEYSIQELSRLSRVTTRTLRRYDQIGLSAHQIILYRFQLIYPQRAV